jgi:ADP-heptose:LPS heptosyltransferase
MYPHQDTVMQRLLDEVPEITFTLVGDPLCKILEAGWEEHPQVRCTSGELDIRDTLALAQRADCVVGPETGVLNAVAFEPMAKVVMLSHSSVENLTKHWENTTSIVPPTSCFPCHRLHHGRKFCPEHEPTGASMCAWESDPEQVIAAILRAYADWTAMARLKVAA